MADQKSSADLGLRGFASAAVTLRKRQSCAALSHSQASGPPELHTKNTCIFMWLGAPRYTIGLRSDEEEVAGTGLDAENKLTFELTTGL